MVKQGLLSGKNVNVTREQSVISSISDSADLFPRTDDNHGDKIHSFFFFADYSFDYGYVRKLTSGLERILCDVLLNDIAGKYG